MRISPVVRSALVVYATLKRKMAEGCNCEGVLTRGFLSKPLRFGPLPVASVLQSSRMVRSKILLITLMGLSLLSK